MNNLTRSFHLAVAICSLIVLSLAASTTRADVRLPHVLGDHMVVQRDKPLPVWGWAEPGEKVSVSLGGQRAATTADAQGRWKVVLGELQAGGPLKLTVQGKNKIVLEDVLVGEVWFCSG